jgi:hypothetical protein
MRFLHSLLYSLFVWVGAVLLGSLLGNVFMYAFLPDHKWDMFDPSPGTFVLMAIFSGFFSIPAFVVLNVVIIAINPLRRERSLGIKLALTAVSLGMSVVCVGLFMNSNPDDNEFLVISAGYPLSALLLSWLYPIEAIAKRKGALSNGSGEVVALYSQEGEPKWFGEELAKRQ